MEPLYILLLCLPAALGLIACGCGRAALWPAAVQPAAHTMVGRKRAGRSLA
jgi:hypothetical protein